MQLTVATNLTDLHREPSFLSELLTQIFNGTTLEVLEEKDKWCRVRQADGYEGWAYRGYLTPEPPPAPTHIVADLRTSIFAEPAESAAPITCLLGGTQIRIEENRGEWMKIAPAGSMLPAGWIARDALRSLATFPLPTEMARQQIVQDARRFTGVYYLWGGNTAFGTDCSGLSSLTHRLSGYALPRDARLQFPVGRTVEPPFQPGDLLFFRSDNDPARIGHVGISTGGWRMIHSSRSRNGVYEEDMQANESLVRTFAGARSFLPQ
jgi:cell wall-associated NlpC family hydrolase